MSEPQTPKREPKTINLATRMFAGFIAAAGAATAAHFVIGDPIATVVAAVFFGLGVAISLGQGRGDGGGGGDAGGG